MSAHVLVNLTLTRKPEQRPAKTGDLYTLANGREGAGANARYWALFVFGETARAEIDRLDVGDTLAVQGQFEAELWRPADKPPSISLRINVDRALALKPQPRRERARGAKAAEGAPPSNECEFDDDIPL